MEHSSHTKDYDNDFLVIDTKNAVAYCKNQWTLVTLPQIDHFLRKIKWPSEKALTISGAELKQMDSAGAWRLDNILQQLKQNKYTIDLKDFAPRFKAIIELIQNQQIKKVDLEKKEPLDILAKIGKITIAASKRIQAFFSFIGAITIVGLRLIFHIRSIHIRAFLSTLETTGFQALPIIALLSFLIGIVLAYQMGLQLRNYGADIFIVDLLGISLFREFGPLITAIIVAGRTASSFTAQIGTMKIKEEIDALQTLGIEPAELLILPKCLALMVVLPLLTVWADIFGVFGGMLMSQHMLEITFGDFLHRFQSAVSISSFVTGMVKAPVFGLIIAAIGCYQGLQVKQSAESVGRHTTQSVVEAIFCIVVVDAIFSILFSYLKI